MNLRDATPADYAAILELNRLSVKVLSPLDEAGLRSLAAIAHSIRVVEREAVQLPTAEASAVEASVGETSVGEISRIAAFVITVRKGCGYQSPNFRWFEAQYDDFLYLDRIVVAEKARGKGLGQQLYTEMISQARAAGIPRIALEVDIEPPNFPSLKFHQKQGFVEVDRFQPYGAKTVSLQIKSLH